MATTRFLEQCRRRKGLVRIVLARVLRGFLGHADANALAGHGLMFVLSEEQVGTLMQRAGVSGRLGGDLLDIGCGNGDVTLNFVSLVQGSILCCEDSMVLRSILSSRGFHVLSPQQLENVSNKFSVVMCLNVLDRIDNAPGLLDRILELMDDREGIAVFALVFPFQPWVQNRWRQWVRPDVILDEKLFEIGNARPLNKQFFEESTDCFLNLLTSRGFIVRAFTRVPYLSETDHYLCCDWDYLHNVVVVCSKAQTS
jgi:hypothetical protein